MAEGIVKLALVTIEEFCRDYGKTKVEAGSPAALKRLASVKLAQA